MTPDVNVLVAAVHADHTLHAPAFTWLRGALADATPVAPFTLLPVVVAGFVRTITNAKIFEVPMPAPGAADALAELLERPHVRVGTHGAEWPRFAALCRERDLRGNAVTDAWIAASVLELNEHLVTFDRDFVRLLAPRHLTMLRP